MESSSTPKYANLGLQEAKLAFVEHLKQINEELGHNWFPTTIVGPLIEDGQGEIPAEIAKVINEIQNILLNDDTKDLGIRARASLIPIIKYRNPYKIPTSEGAPPTHHTRYFGDLFTDDQHVVGLLSVLWPVFQIKKIPAFAVTRNRFEDRPVTTLDSILCQSFIQAVQKINAEAVDRLKLVLRVSIIHEMAHVLVERHMDPGGGAFQGYPEASQTPPQLSIEHMSLGEEIVMPGHSGEAGTVVEQGLLGGLIETAPFFLNQDDYEDYKKAEGDDEDFVRYLKGSLAIKTYRILNPPQKISGNVERMIKYYFITHYIKPEAIARQIQSIIPKHFEADDLSYLISFGIEWEAVVIRAYVQNLTLPLKWTEDQVEGKLPELVKEFQERYAEKIAAEEKKKREDEEAEKIAAENRGGRQGNQGDMLKGRSQGAKNRARPSKSTSRGRETKEEKKETD